MSHIVEEYAKCCGVNIGKPIINEHFYPIVSEKYISIDLEADNASDVYLHWPIVFQILKKQFKEENIKIVQIGNKETQKNIYADELHRNCSYKNKFYIIKNSLLHLGVNNLSCHVASCYNKNIVNIVGDNFPDCCRPYWSDKNKTKTLSPNFSDKKPLFNLGENTKRINEIKPEEIVSAVFSFLNIDYKDGYKSVHLGKSYGFSRTEFIPNCETSGLINHENINVRLDKEHNESCLSEIFSFANIEITTAKPIDEKFLIKEKIKCINYISDFFDGDFIEKVSSLGITLNLMCTKEENLKKMRGKFFDHKIINYDTSEQIKMGKEKLGEVDFNKLKISSARQIVSKNTIYSSYYEISGKKEDLFLDLDWIMCYYVDHE